MYTYVFVYENKVAYCHITHESIEKKPDKNNKVDGLTRVSTHIQIRFSHSILKIKGNINFLEESFTNRLIFSLRLIELCKRCIHI